MDAPATTSPQFAVYWDYGRHTCIRVGERNGSVLLIPMEASEVRVVRMAEREFVSTYTPVPEYPVKRAAEIYLGAPGKTVDAQARDLLRRILADPSLDYDRSKFSVLPIHQPLKESTMATKKTAAAAAEDSKPVKKTAAATKATAQPTAKAAKAEKPTKSAKEDNATYTVADASSVKRGFIADYVAAAQKLGTFTRDKLNGKFADVEAAKLVRYFYYCTGHGIFAEAK